jgi:hypothetical protein
VADFGASTYFETQLNRKNRKNPKNWRQFSSDLALKGSSMSLTNRILLAAVILLLDLVVFFFPLTAVFLAYIIIFNPPWFREFINHLDPAEKT